MNNSSPSVNSLLINIKSIVELVIRFSGDSLTSQYGAIERLRTAILSILSHGLKQNSGNLYEQLWQLIVRLNANSQKYIHLLQEVYHKENLPISVEQWIDQSVITQCLSQQLSSMENDSDCLQHYYYSYAFMRMPPFYHAFVICIRTIEYSDPSLLSNIDPKLSIVGLHHAAPTTDVIYRSNSSTTPMTLNNSNNATKYKMSTSILISDDNQQKLPPITKQRILHRRIHSDPVFHFDNTTTNRSYLTSPSLVDDIKLNNETNSPRVSYNQIDEYGSTYDSRTNSLLSLEQSIPVEQSRQSISSKITLIDEEENNIYQETKHSAEPELTKRTARLPHSSLFWPRKDQTLDNYIRDCDSQTRTDVEKENAHFYFSEAIISAVEYIKFSQQCEKYFDQSCLTQTLLSTNNFVRSARSSMSKSSSQELSAEAIALTFMEKWRNYKIPTAPELFWMIPRDEDISDEVIPIRDRNSFDRSGDYPTKAGNQRMLRRGNNQWAPPREQLIFHIPRSNNRDSQLKKQGYLCAGCGRDVEKGYAHRFRYCEYTGKYFCRNCHFDKKFYLPSYIITKWEFSNKHSISNFAYDYLNRIYTEGTFNLNDLNPNLYEKSTKLKLLNELRWSFYFLRDYILTCRFAEEKGDQQILQELSSYIYTNPHVYSLQDLVQTKSGELYKQLEPIVMHLREHVLTCDLCYAKGFICEICDNDKDIIFPFNVQTTSICPVCQSCFHIRCHEKKKYQCPKCQRTKLRIGLTSTNRSNTSTDC